jgi:hypothetical protein
MWNYSMYWSIFPEYNMQILLGDFSATREYIFKPTVGNETFHENKNDNEVGVMTFAISANSTKSTIFPHHEIHRYTRTSDGRTHSYIDHILIARQWQSSILDVQHFKRG